MIIVVPGESLNGAWELVRFVLGAVRHDRDSYDQASSILKILRVASPQTPIRIRLLVAMSAAS